MLCSAPLLLGGAHTFFLGPQVRPPPRADCCSGWHADVADALPSACQGERKLEKHDLAPAEFWNMIHI